LKSKLKVGVLELDYEIDKNLVFHLSYDKLLSTFPELFSHPVSNDGHISEIVNVSSDINYFVSKKTRKPKLSPSSSIFFLINQSQRNNLAKCDIKSFIDFDLLVLSHLLDKRKSIVCSGIHEGMGSFVNEIKKTAS
jgi:hypothetical protein